MKKIIFVYVLLILFIGVFADNVSNVVDLKDQIYIALGTFLIALLGVLTKFITSYISSYVESQKDKKYYEALAYAENILTALIAEAEVKVVTDIKKKYIDNPDDPKKYVELGKVANTVVENALNSIPDKYLDEIKKHEKGLLPNLIKPIIAKQRWLNDIDFRSLRDKLNIPKM